MKEIKDDTNRWRDTSSSWMGRVNIVKMTKVHKAIHRFNAIPITWPLAFSTKLEQKFYSLYGKQKDSQELKQTRKKNGAVRIRLPALRLYYKAIVTKTVWHWNKNRNTDQWYRKESPVINLHIYGSLSLWQGRQEHILEKREVSFISRTGKTGQNEIKTLP